MLFGRVTPPLTLFLSFLHRGPRGYSAIGEALPPTVTATTETRCRPRATSCSSSFCVMGPVCTASIGGALPLTARATAALCPPRATARSSAFRVVGRLYVEKCGRLYYWCGSPANGGRRRPNGNTTIRSIRTMRRTPVGRQRTSFPWQSYRPCGSSSGCACGGALDVQASGRGSVEMKISTSVEGDDRPDLGFPSPPPPPPPSAVSLTTPAGCGHADAAASRAAGAG